MDLPYSSSAPDPPLFYYITPQCPIIYLEEPPYRPSMVLLFYHNPSVPQYSPGGASLQVLSTRFTSILLHNPSVPQYSPGGASLQVLSTRFTSILLHNPSVPQYSPGGASLHVLSTRSSFILPSSPSVLPVLTWWSLLTGPQHQSLYSTTQPLSALSTHLVEPPCRFSAQGPPLSC